MTDKKTLVSGLQPSGRPHIGNYFGAMKQFVELQHQYDSFIFIADLHTLTTVQEKDTLSQYIYDLAVDFLAIGLDPEEVTLYKQSDVPEVTEATWVFDCLITTAFLERAHAYKDAVSSGKKNPSVGLFNYPVLMAADILLPRADVVPVGRDQKQHLEYTRDIAEKFNSTFGETFSLPEPLIVDAVATVPGIDGEKMSKSYGNTIPLFADNDTLRECAMSVVTDSKPVDAPKDPDDTLFTLLSLFLEEEELPRIKEAYTSGELGYKEAKELLAENLIEFIEPLREKRRGLADDRDYVLGVLEEGGKRASDQIAPKMAEVRRKVGIAL